MKILNLKVIKNLQCLVINNEIKLKLISCLKQGKHMQEKYVIELFFDQELFNDYYFQMSKL